MDLHSGDKLCAFDGRKPHETEPYQLGEDEDRFTIIFFLGYKHWKIKGEDYVTLGNMGFNLPGDDEEARAFAQTFPYSSGSYYAYLPAKIKDPAGDSLRFWHRTGLIGDFCAHDKHMKFWGHRWQTP